MTAGHAWWRGGGVPASDGFGLGFATRHLPTVVMRLFDTLQDVLAERDARSSGPGHARMRMRASLNISPVLAPSRGSAAAVGGAVITTHRLLDAPEVRDLLRRSDPGQTFLAVDQRRRVRHGDPGGPPPRWVPPWFQLGELNRDYGAIQDDDQGIPNSASGKFTGPAIQAATMHGGLHIGKGEPARSYYLTRIESFTSRGLVDRVEELSELARFCTSPGTAGAYAWWCADTWTGKSASLSTFVLEPSPGVPIVAFFITCVLCTTPPAAATTTGSAARWTARSDREARKQPRAELQANNGTALTILAQTLEVTATAGQGGLVFCHPDGAIAIFAWRTLPCTRAKLADLALTGDRAAKAVCAKSGSRSPPARQ